MSACWTALTAGPLSDALRTALPLAIFASCVTFAKRGFASVTGSFSSWYGFASSSRRFAPPPFVSIAYGLGGRSHEVAPLALSRWTPTAASASARVDRFPAARWTLIAQRSREPASSRASDAAALATARAETADAAEPDGGTRRIPDASRRARPTAQRLAVPNGRSMSDRAEVGRMACRVATRSARWADDQRRAGEGQG